LIGEGEWKRTLVPGPRKIMSEADWMFFNRHFHANETLYSAIEEEIFELPPGEESPKAIRQSRSGRANATGRSMASYRRPLRRAA
jgi:hypothetical protein